jgi:hypothetical protein
MGFPCFNSFAGINTTYVKNGYASDPIRYKSMGTAELRESSMVKDLFGEEAVALT